MSGPQLNTLLRIDSVWVAVSVDDNGNEGVCAFMTEMGWMPLIAADEARLKQIVPMAERIAERDQRLVRIIKLTSREEFKVIDKRQ